MPLKWKDGQLDLFDQGVLPLLLKPSEAAIVLAISERKLWELTNRGDIPCLKIGRCVRYSVDDLKQYIEKMKKNR